MAKTELIDTGVTSDVTVRMLTPGSIDVTGYDWDLNEAPSMIIGMSYDESLRCWVQTWMETHEGQPLVGSVYLPTSYDLDARVPLKNMRYLIPAV